MTYRMIDSTKLQSNLFVSTDCSMLLTKRPKEIHTFDSVKHASASRDVETLQREK